MVPQKEKFDGNHKSSFILLLLQMLFTIAYTATVIPFTVSFLRHIATPSATAEDVLPLVKIFFIFMPVFLIALEFASIWLVCRFWSDNKDSWIALVLFLCVQSLPATSFYYDCRKNDYLKEKANFEQMKSEKCSAITTKINGIKEQILKIDNEVVRLKNDRDFNYDNIKKIIMPRRKSNIDSLQEEYRTNVEFRQKRESEISELMASRKILFDKFAFEENDLALSRQSQLSYRSEIDFIITNFFNSKNYPALYFSSLFPLSLLAVGFFLTRSKIQAVVSNQYFDLNGHLEKIASSFQPDAHPFYAQSLIPPLEAYLLVKKASLEMIIENDRLNQKLTLHRAVAGEVNDISNQISKSRLQAGAKNRLIDALKAILERNLISK